MKPFKQPIVVHDRHGNILKQAGLRREVTNARDYAVAQSALRLRDAGFRVRFEDARVNPTDIETIGAELLRRAREIPAAFFSLFFRHLATFFDEEARLYRVGLELAPGMALKNPALPLGLLYYVAAASVPPCTKGLWVASTANEKRALSLFEDYRAYANVLDVEKWRAAETMFFDPGTLLRQVADDVIFNEAFLPHTLAVRR